MAYKRPFAHRTRFVEVDMKNDHKWDDDISPQTYEMEKKKDALPKKSGKVVLFDQRRPSSDDQMVVSHNKTALGVLGDNMDCQFLGDESASKAVMMYLVNYCTSKSAHKKKKQSKSARENETRFICEGHGNQTGAFIKYGLSGAGCFSFTAAAALT